MKTLGIIGGIGPESTIDYYRSIIAGYRKQRPDSFPSIVITSLDVGKLLGWMESNQLDAVVDYLAPEVARLAAAGADFGLIAANTPHIVFDEVQRRSPIPLISIVEATCSAAKVRAAKRVGLMGTRFTMQGKFYPEVFSREGISLVTPDAEQQIYIHDKYVNELLKNTFLPATRDRLMEIVVSMRERDQVDAVILAGTELPLILRQEHVPETPLLDTTQIHVESAVDRLLT